MVGAARCPLLVDVRAGRDALQCDRGICTRHAALRDRALTLALALTLTLTLALTRTLALTLTLT